VGLSKPEISWALNWEHNLLFNWISP